jgi:hypothetical protein
MALWHYGTDFLRFFVFLAVGDRYRRESPPSACHYRFCHAPSDETRPARIASGTHTHTHTHTHTKPSNEGHTHTLNLKNCFRYTSISRSLLLLC